MLLPRGIVYYQVFSVRLLSHFYIGFLKKSYLIVHQILPFYVLH